MPHHLLSMHYCQWLTKIMSLVLVSSLSLAAPCKVSDNHHPRARKQLNNSREIIIDSKQKLVSRSGGEIPIILALTRPAREGS